jgi:hypothetical protein
MQGKTILTVIMDETGSMIPRKEATISGFNEFIESQKDKALGDCQATLIKFNSDRILTVFKDLPIQDVPELTRNDFQPASTTPLYDAIAQGILDTEGQIKKVSDVLARISGAPADGAMPFIVVLVMTDGEENASKAYNREKIFDMVNDRKKKGWSFVFLGADMDAWAQASQVAFAANNVQRYAGTQTRAAYQNVSNSLRAHRTLYTAAMTSPDTAAMPDVLLKASVDFFGTTSKDTLPDDQVNNLA